MKILHRRRELTTQQQIFHITRTSEEVEGCMKNYNLIMSKRKLKEKREHPKLDL
jgi:hypothetical protein